MNIILDIAIILILALSCIIMAKRGFAKAVLSIGANIVTLVLLATLITPVTDAVSRTSIGDSIKGSAQEIILESTSDILPGIADKSSDMVLKIVVAIVLFIVLKVVLALLCLLVGTIFKLPVLSQLNTLAGGLAGLINGLLIIYIACAVISLDFEWAREIQAAAGDTLVFKFFYENNLLINLFIG